VRAVFYLPAIYVSEQGLCSVRHCCDAYRDLQINAALISHLRLEQCPDAERVRIAERIYNHIFVLNSELPGAFTATFSF
jgi:hypothetical protein